MEPWGLNIQERSCWFPEPYLWKSDIWGAFSSKSQRVCVQDQPIILFLDHAVFSLKIIIVSVVHIICQQQTSCSPIRPVIDAWYMNPSRLLGAKVNVFYLSGGISTEAWVATQGAISFDSKCHHYLLRQLSSESCYPRFNDSIHLIAWLWLHPNFEGVVVNLRLCNANR